MKTPQVAALHGMTPLGIKPRALPLTECQQKGKTMGQVIKLTPKMHELVIESRRLRSIRAMAEIDLAPNYNRYPPQLIKTAA